MEYQPDGLIAMRDTTDNGGFLFDDQILAARPPQFFNIPEFAGNPVRSISAPSTPLILPLTDQARVDVLPLSLPHFLRVSMATYCRSVTSPTPSIPLAEEDWEIARLIQARMQHLEGVLGNQFSGDSEANLASQTPESISTPGSPHSDIAAHLHSHHPDHHFEQDHVLCKWTHCDKGRPILKRSLVKHIKNVHLREGRVACTHPGCIDSFSRRDAMLRHVKKVHIQPLE
ncbi:hypothetical protein DAEQUDRAFT_739696 [Daedalea quercina L-15889]|uniref:C2H2-type domain-containing protein n=1 Tax=Daedalea quercina L-15889 TaxID=1314783 RepID=A0A165NGE8_9APHY|nr:hypothetical protein DAEQUDRAFT_739696 [Daedalea quercina L-15889]